MEQETKLNSVCIKEAYTLNEIKVAYLAFDRQDIFFDFIDFLINSDWKEETFICQNCGYEGKEVEYIEKDGCPKCGK